MQHTNIKDFLSNLYPQKKQELHKYSLTDRQKIRVKAEIKQDIELETTKDLAWLDAAPDFSWESESEKKKKEIIRQVVMDAIKDVCKVRSEEKLHDLSVFFNDKVTINKSTYPSLFYVYASYLGHPKSWVDIATHYCTSQITSALCSISERRVVA